MTPQDKAKQIALIVKTMFPDARCELDYRNELELLVAIMLSAQTTDLAVNRVTPALFKAFPTLESYRDAELSAIESSIHHLGLFRNKALHLQSMSQTVLNTFNGQIPSNLEDLESLPGVGRKTANVFLAVWHKVPRIAVDTHVERVAKRLGLVEASATPLQVEKVLMTLFPEDEWIDLHHRILFFGRYHCTAKKPSCLACSFLHICEKPSF
jgi:endonuclease-3